jgi:hypothetical protein
MPVPILESVGPSNEGQIDRCLQDHCSASPSSRHGRLAREPAGCPRRASPWARLRVADPRPQVAVSRLLAANSAYVENAFLTRHGSSLTRPTRLSATRRFAWWAQRIPRQSPPQTCRWSHRGRLGASPRLVGLRRRPPVRRHQLAVATFTANRERAGRKCGRPRSRPLCAAICVSVSEPHHSRVA